MILAQSFSIFSINGGVGGIRLRDGLRIDPELRQKRESVDASHTPLVVGHILSVDQVADLTGCLHRIRRVKYIMPISPLRLARGRLYWPAWAAA